MTVRGVLLFLPLVTILGVAGGCSRTYDGSVVPTYEFATDRFAGIPYLTVRPTALDAPNTRDLATPAPAADSDFETPGPRMAETVRPEPVRPRAARRTVRRAVPAASAPPTTLKCRDEAPGPRLVRMVCE